MTTDQKYFTIGTVAIEVGVPRWKLADYVERGMVPGPSLQVPGRRLFTEDDISRIREALTLRAKAPIAHTHAS
jgi:DNA-binding transcriptional MerR regulator